MSESSPQSPTSLVLGYLASKGLPPSTENVRRALEANQRDPSIIPGLTNDVAGVDPTGGQTPRGNNLPVPLIPPNNRATGGGEPQTTSAPPSGSVGSGAQSSGDLSDGQDALDPIGALGALITTGLGLWGASRMAGGGGSAVAGGMPAPAGAPQLGGPEPMPQIGGPDPMLQLQGPQAPMQLEGQAPTMLEGPMQKAIAGPGPQAQITGAGQPPPIEPYQPMAAGVQPVPQQMVGDMQRGPATADPSVSNENMISSGMKAPPRVPLRPRPPSGDLGALLGNLMRGVR